MQKARSTYLDSVFFDLRAAAACALCGFLLLAWLGLRHHDAPPNLATLKSRTHITKK